MATQQQLAGSWNEIKKNVKEKWNNVTDADLRQVEGDINRLVSMIQHKSGEARDKIEEFVMKYSESSADMMSSAAAAAKDYASQAVAAARDGWGTAATTIKRHPAETAVISFGSGVLLGVVLGLLSQRR